MERTSKAVAQVAAQLLNGRRMRQAVAWLKTIADAPASTPDERDHATLLLGTISGMKRVAGSALTQR